MQSSESDFQTKKLAIISGGHFVHDVFSSFTAPFLPLLIAKFGLSMTLAGSLTVFFRLPSLFNPLFGMISDRVNLRQVVIWAPALTAAVMSLLGVAPNYATLCIFLLLGGTSAAIFHVLGPVLIGQSSGKNLGKGLSFWMTGGELARTMGPLVAVWAVSTMGFERCYPIMGVGIFASFLLSISLKDANTATSSTGRRCVFLYACKYGHRTGSLWGTQGNGYGPIHSRTVSECGDHYHFCGLDGRSIWSQDGIHFERLVGAVRHPAGFIYSQTRPE